MGRSTKSWVGATVVESLWPLINQNSFKPKNINYMKWCITQTNTSVSGEAAAKLWYFVILTAWLRSKMTWSLVSSWEDWSNRSIMLHLFSIWIHIFSYYSCESPRKIVQLSLFWNSLTHLVNVRWKETILGLWPELIHFDRNTLIQSPDISSLPLTLLRRWHSSDLILSSLYKSKTISLCVLQMGFWKLTINSSPSHGGFSIYVLINTLQEPSKHSLWNTSPFSKYFQI